MSRQYFEESRTRAERKEHSMQLGERALELRNQGLGWVLIGKRLGVSHETARQLAKIALVKQRMEPEKSKAATKQ